MNPLPIISLTLLLLAPNAHGEEGNPKRRLKEDGPISFVPPGMVAWKEEWIVVTNTDCFTYWSSEQMRYGDPMREKPKEATETMQLSSNLVATISYKRKTFPVTLDSIPFKTETRKYRIVEKKEYEK